MSKPIISDSSDSVNLTPTQKRLLQTMRDGRYVYRRGDFWHDEKTHNNYSEVLVIRPLIAAEYLYEQYDQDGDEWEATISDKAVSHE